MIVLLNETLRTVSSTLPKIHIFSGYMHSHQSAALYLTCPRVSRFLDISRTKHQIRQQFETCLVYIMVLTNLTHNKPNENLKKKYI